MSVETDLLASLAQHVRSSGAGGLTTAADLRAFLTELVAEIADQRTAYQAKAVRFSADAARTPTYYAAIGTAAAENADDGLVVALREATPGQTVRVLAPLVFPHAKFYPAVLLMSPDTTLDLAGFNLITDPAKQHDGIGFPATGEYTIYGGHATLQNTGNGSSSFTWPGEAVPLIRAYDVHIVNAGSANGIFMRSGTLVHRGSLTVRSATSGVIGVSVYAQGAAYELIGDLTLSNGAYGLDVLTGCSALVRQGRCRLLDANSCLAEVYDEAQLELQQYVVDLSPGPTTNGTHLLGTNARLVLTDVTVLGGSLVRETSPSGGTIVLRGRTTLPADYGVDYLQNTRGSLVLDERT